MGEESAADGGQSGSEYQRATHLIIQTLTEHTHNLKSILKEGKQKPTMGRETDGDRGGGIGGA